MSDIPIKAERELNTHHKKRGTERKSLSGMLSSYVHNPVCIVCKAVAN